MELKILQGDAIEQMRTLPDGCVQCCVTSPPYFRQRKYLPDHHDLKRMEIGREKSPQDYTAKLVLVFAEVFRVLRDDGTLWVVIDDKMIAGQLAGIPWCFAMAMKSFGWRLIMDIIWNKPNPTPQSVKKRPTRAHEYVFMFSKSQGYFYDREAIRTPYAASTVPRQMRAVSGHHKHINGAPGQSPHSMSQPRINVRDIYAGVETKDYEPNGAQKPSDTKRRILESLMKYPGANKKSVWTVPKGSFKGNHFATFPPDLIKPCILAGTKPGDMVLDPFGGSGTTGAVAHKLGRGAILIDLNPDYIPLMQQRTDVALGLQPA